MSNYEVGVNLSGGGARGSYQAGALRALSEILKEQGLLRGGGNPLKYWSAVSAGSINASVCVAGIQDLEAATKQLCELWTNVTPEQVYLSDAKSLSSNGMRWIKDLTFGSFTKEKSAKSLLDTKPLWDLIDKNINYANLDANIKSGLVRGLACTAYSYFNNRTVTFLNSTNELGWNKPRRYSVNVPIRTEHIVASCSIPMLFPSTHIGNEYFADGSFRNTSPISPVIHMGAKKIFVIGVRGPNEFDDKEYKEEPSIAKISGSILNALFFDTTDVDLERVIHINELVETLKKDIVTKRSDYSTIQFHVIKPSRDVSKIAEEKFKNFPKMLKFMIGGLGPRSESAELASYILFVTEFTKELVNLGYNDVMKSKADVLKWLES
jgi:NTE family protein